MTTVQHLETLLSIARHVAEHGDPIEAQRARARIGNYEWAIAILRRCA